VVNIDDFGCGHEINAIAVFGATARDELKA
jgi:hypothetical protein